MEENYHSIFNRFFQGDGVESGTGIGLYMVKQLVEMHHGSIFLKSEMGKGTSFVVILPKNIPLFESKNFLDYMKYDILENKC